jgi:hypothetical protein
LKLHEQQHLETTPSAAYKNATKQGLTFTSEGLNQYYKNKLTKIYEDRSSMSPVFRIMRSKEPNQLHEDPDIHIDPSY